MCDNRDHHAHAQGTDAANANPLADSPSKCFCLTMSLCFCAQGDCSRCYCASNDACQCSGKKQPATTES